MIIAYTGLPGGGKSLSALSDYVLPALKEGRQVFCNIAGLSPMRVAGHLGMTTSKIGLRLRRFAMAFDDADARERKEFWKTRPDGSRYYADAEGLGKLLEEVMSHREAVLVLDECHEYLAPENWKILRPFLKYLSMARHYGHDIVLITQHVDDVWPPLKNRIHETHNFVRGALGFKTQYRENVYHGWNVYKEPGYSRQRVNDKALYGLYASHDGGAKERLGYPSVWRNRKLVAMLLVGVMALAGSLSYLIAGGGLFAFARGPEAPPAEDGAPRYERESGAVYVRYVVCGAFDCLAVRADGSELRLPLDYDSGKYPITVRRIGSAQNNPAGSIFAPGIGAGGR